MKKIFTILLKNKWRKAAFILTSAVIAAFLFMQFLYPPFFEWYTGVENGELTFDSSVEVTPAEFEKIARELTHDYRLKKAEAVTQAEENRFTRNIKTEMLMNTPSFRAGSEFSHIKYFRNAGILRYEGPQTCLTCHEEMSVKKPNGTIDKVNTMEDVLNTVHFQFQSMAGGFTTYGYDGRQVNVDGRAIPVGKIDRACGIPGSFSWTGWAALIETKPAHLNGGTELRSEGCGQCHIGGNYHPATEKMMPIGDVAEAAKDGIDCLICHSQAYDMNYKYVIKDEKGTRWNQDRTLKAALAVTKPTNDNCLNCHQHNMGGDTYALNAAAEKLGYKNKRILHAGSKRGNPFSSHDDVHAAAGVQCLDCHEPEGHKIPRGTKGTDLVANDLPGKEVSCEKCHTAAPHTKNELTRVVLNGHTARIACETCHIPALLESSVVLRDWVNPVWNAHEGMYEPADILRSGQPGSGFTYLWFNGNGTFLANALGNNPNKTGSYVPLMDRITSIKDEKLLSQVRENIRRELGINDAQLDKYIKSFSNTLSQMPDDLIDRRRQVIESNLSRISNMGESKIYPFKLFNAYMYEDMTNNGPFGAMILPFDYAVYYQTGKPLDAVKKAIQHPIVKRMYETPFKYYMMDEFMYYFGVDGWSGIYPIDDKGNLRNVKPNWMRQYGTLMVNHGIKKDGLSCASCHSPNGVMDFEGLGYTPERVKDLQNLPELKYFKSASKPAPIQPNGSKPAAAQKSASARAQHGLAQH